MSEPAPAPSDSSKTSPDAKSAAWTKSAIPAWFIFFSGILLSIVIASYQKQDIEGDEKRQFAFAADQVTLKIRERLESYELILRGAAGLFATSRNVTRSEWKAYVDTIRTEDIVPGVQGTGFSKLIQPSELANHIAAVRAQGYPTYTVHPPGDRPVYTSITFLEPFRDRNLRAFGYDMYSEPVRRAAMDRARDRGEAALSAPVRLVQETESDVQTGTLMYVPVYLPGAPLNTMGERRAALIGWAYSPYRMKDLMSGILRDWQGNEGRYVDLRIYHKTEGKPEDLLYRSAETGTDEATSTFVQRRVLGFHGQSWLLSFGRLSAAPPLRYTLAWASLIGGFAFTSLLFALMRSLVDTKENAEHIAEKLTVDIRHNEQLLRESEYRWKFAIEGAGDGIWDWNLAEDTVFLSKRYQEMLGYEEGEIGEAPADSQSLIHPDDRAATSASLQAHFAGKAPIYTSERRMRCKDGSYKWTLVRGTVVSRDAEGHPLRIIGTQKDISASKALQASLEESQKELLEALRIGQAGTWRIELPSNKISWTEEVSRMIKLDPGKPPPDLIELSKFTTADSYARMMSAIDELLRSGTAYESDLEVVRTDGTHGWVQARGEAVHAEDGKIIAIRGLIRDISEQKQDRSRITHLTRLYAALSGCNRAVIHCHTQEELFSQVCRIAIDRGGMNLCWIGLIDAETGDIRPAAAYGVGEDYMDYVNAINASARPDNPRSNGPSGTCVRENRPIWIDDFQTSSRTAPWHSLAVRFGWRASAALPIARNGKVIGVLTFYSTEGGWFNEEMRKLLEEMAESISFALDKLDAEAESKTYQDTLIEAERRFDTLVEQSIAGTYILQDGKIVYANPRLAAILGYENSEALIGHSPSDFVHPKDREDSVTRLRRITSGELTKGEGVFTALRKDGTTVEVASENAVSTYKSRPAIIGLLQDTSDRKVAEDQIRRYAQQLEHTFMQAVQLTTTLNEMRDPYTVGHERRVAEISVAIGREMGLDENTLEGLRVGGYLHDVGKIVVPAEILTKPGKLSANEFALIREHAQAGYNVLKEVDFPWPVAQIALQHHERIDGSGYPNGLSGNQMILEARITAIADVVDAMTTHRPYRPGLGLDLALEEIERGAGKLYDSQAAAACLRLFREKGFKVDHTA